MRAQEFLQEQDANSEPQWMATVGETMIWQVPASLYEKVFNLHKDGTFGTPKPVPSSNSKILLLCEDNHHPSDLDWRWPNYYRFLASHDQQLTNLLGSYTVNVSVLKKLAALTGAKNAPKILTRGGKEHVLFQGKISPTKQLVTLYDLPPLSDGSPVSSIPKNLLWTVGESLWPNDEDFTWDTKWTIKNSIAGEIRLYSQSGQIIAAYYPPNKAAQAIKNIKELAQRESLTLAIDLPEPEVAKEKRTKPGSNMHKMLAYIADHPGATRSDWFVGHLGNSAQGMQGWTSDKATDGVAASMGWIKNTGTSAKYSLSITPMGKLVLAGLNKGLSIKHTKQI